MNDFLLTRWQYEWLLSLNPNRYDEYKKYLDANFEVEPAPEITDIIERLNRLVGVDDIDRLGSLPIDQGTNLDTITARGIYRVASTQEIPGIQDIGYRTSTVYFDEPFDWAEANCQWPDGFVASEWLEHRVFCKRTLLECLSGE